MKHTWLVGVAIFLAVLSASIAIRNASIINHTEEQAAFTALATTPIVIEDQDTTILGGACTINSACYYQGYKWVYFSVDGNNFLLIGDVGVVRTTCCDTLQ